MRGAHVLAWSPGSRNCELTAGDGRGTMRGVPADDATAGQVSRAA